MIRPEGTYRTVNVAPLWLWKFSTGAEALFNGAASGTDHKGNDSVKPQENQSPSAPNHYTTDRTGTFVEQARMDIYITLVDIDELFGNA